MIGLAIQKTSEQNQALDAFFEKDAQECDPNFDAAEDLPSTPAQFL